MIGGLSLAVANQRFNPASLPLTLWARAEYTGSPWSGVSSVGSSAGRDLTGVSSHTPTTGNPLNGLSVANCNWATGQGFTNAAAMSTLLTASAWSATALIYVAAAHNNNVNSYQNDIVMLDTGQFWGVLIKANGGSPLALAYQWDGADHAASTSISTGAWSLVQARFDGTNIQIRVNGNAWSSQASGNITTLTGTYQALYNGNAFDGRCAEIMVSNTTFSDATMEKIRVYTNSRYALSL